MLYKKCVFTALWHKHCGSADVLKLDTEFKLWMILHLYIFNNQEWKKHVFSFIFSEIYADFAYNDSQLSYLH